MGRYVHAYPDNVDVGPVSYGVVGNLWMTLDAAFEPVDDEIPDIGDFIIHCLRSPARNPRQAGCFFLMPKVV